MTSNTTGNPASNATTEAGSALELGATSRRAP